MVGMVRAIAVAIAPTMKMAARITHRISVSEAFTNKEPLVRLQISYTPLLSCDIFMQLITIDTRVCLWVRSQILYVKLRLVILLTLGRKRSL